MDGGMECSEAVMPERGECRMILNLAIRVWSKGYMTPDLENLAVESGDEIVALIVLCTA